MKKAVSLLLAAVLAITLLGCRTAGETLVIYTWEDYVPGEVVEDFEKATGIKVVYASFSSNEEMFNSFVQKTNQYDLILCSDYIIDKMAESGGLLKELDKPRIANYGNIDPVFQGQYFDPDNKYAIPYATGSPTIVYDSAKVSFPITGIKDLWNPNLRESIVLLDDVRDIMGMTLLMMGEDVNETDPEILERAKQELISLKPNIIAFNADYPHESIIRGDATVGYMYGSQATAAWEAVPTVEFVFPEEGVTTYIDCFVLSASAPNLDNSYTFLNYILNGEVSAKMSGIINYGNCNTAAKDFLPEEYLNNRSVNIPSEIQATAQFYLPLGEYEILYDIIWTEFKAAN
jgi:spermidine/putrescine transport system substrate-binding protein